MAVAYNCLAIPLAAAGLVVPAAAATVMAAASAAVAVNVLLLRKTKLDSFVPQGLGA